MKNSDDIPSFSQSPREVKYALGPGDQFLEGSQQVYRLPRWRNAAPGVHDYAISRDEKADKL